MCVYTCASMYESLNDRLTQKIRNTVEINMAKVKKRRKIHTFTLTDKKIRREREREYSK